MQGSYQTFYDPIGARKRGEARFMVYCFLFGMILGLIVLFASH